MQILRNGLFMLLTAALLIACSSSNSPEKVAKDYINAVLANDIDALMNTLYIPADADEDQETLMRGKLSMMLAETSTRVIRQGGVKEVTYSTAEYNTEKTRATMTATIHYKNDNAAKKSEKIVLVDTKDGWKVSL